MINVERDGDEIISITINGDRIDSDDGELWIVPKSVLAGVTIAELPDNIEFQPCRQHEDSVVFLDSIPMRIRKVASNKVAVTFEDSGTRKYWDGEVGFKPYMEAKKQAVEEREKEIGDIKLESYEDDGAWISLIYSSEFETDTLHTAVQLAEQLISEVEGAAELSLGGKIALTPSPTNEEEFTVRILLPILRKLGFCNIKYNHGKREFGKDVVFARMTEFQELEHWGAQVKYGDINGGANSEIDYIIAQTDDAFKMPFFDIYTRQQQRISKLVIIASGKFTENAIEKICQKIEINALKNNLVFIDGEKIESLAEKFRDTRT